MEFIEERGRNRYQGEVGVLHRSHLELSEENIVLLLFLRRPS